MDRSNKRIVRAFFFAASLFLYGCGGGGVSGVDNSTALQNQYGYFGPEVKYGSYTVARWWTLLASNGETLHIRFYADGSFTSDLADGDYGVDASGITIRGSTVNDLSILSTLHDYYRSTDTEGQRTTMDCYRVGAGGNQFTMCPVYL